MENPQVTPEQRNTYTDVPTLVTFYFFFFMVNDKTFKTCYLCQFRLISLKPNKHFNFKVTPLLRTRGGEW